MMRFLDFSGMPFIPWFYSSSLLLAGSAPKLCLGLKLGQSEGWIEEFQAEAGMDELDSGRMLVGEWEGTNWHEKCSETQIPYFVPSFTHSANIY